MNNQRRAQIRAIYKDLDRIKPLIEAYEAASEALKGAMDDVSEAIQSIRDDEQEALDNLPESLQDGEKGQDMQCAIDALERAMEMVSFENISFDSGIDTDDIIGVLDEAVGC